MGRHPDFLYDSSVWVAPPGFNMVSGLGPFRTWAKWAWSISNVDQAGLGPLSSGSKDHGTHNSLIFPIWNFVLFQLGKILCFKPWVWKVERTGEINAYIRRAGR